MQLLNIQIFKTISNTETLIKKNTPRYAGNTDYSNYTLHVQLYQEDNRRIHHLSLKSTKVLSNRISKKANNYS
jgi:sulfur relay (sulfurtransferase) DsrF/TusC family protein